MYAYLIKNIKIGLFVVLMALGTYGVLNEIKGVDLQIFLVALLVGFAVYFLQVRSIVSDVRDACMVRDYTFVRVMPTMRMFTPFRWRFDALNEYTFWKVAALDGQGVAVSGWVQTRMFMKLISVGNEVYWQDEVEDWEVNQLSGKV